MYELLFPYLLGAVLAWITCYPARFLRPEAEQWFFTVILVLVAIAFVGFPLEHDDPAGMLHEAVAAVALLLLVVLSWWWLPALLPLAFLLHGLWDLGYLMGWIASTKPAWIVQLCVPYDSLVALFLIGRWDSWRAKHLAGR